MDDAIHAADTSELSVVASLESDYSEAHSALSRLLADQAALVDALAAATTSNAVDPNDEEARQVHRLHAENVILAAQVEALQLRLTHMQEKGSDGSSSRSSSTSSSKKRFQARLQGIPEVVAADTDDQTDAMSTIAPSISTVKRRKQLREQLRVAALAFSNNPNGEYENRSLDDSTLTSIAIPKPSKSSKSRASKTSNAKRSHTSSSRPNKTTPGFEPPLLDYRRNESPPGSQAWKSLAFLCTFLIPDPCIPRTGGGAKQAWRCVTQCYQGAVE
jgi:hypothetical protein